MDYTAFTAPPDRVTQIAIVEDDDVATDERVAPTIEHKAVFNEYGELWSGHIEWR
jgi:hypothetical protein